MKKIISFLLSTIMYLSMFGTVFAAEFNFTDVKTSDWFYNDVKSAVEMGLVNGKTPTTYAPNDNLTYAEAIKLAACMNQLYVDGAITLKGGSPWYQPYVEYCLDNKIIEKEYNYEDVATRAGYMGIFAKALPDEGLEAINNVPDNSIPDVSSSKTYAAGVYKLYRAGILTGVDEAHNCNPLANIKRSEVAAILTRMMDETKRVEFSMGAEAEKEPEEKEPEEKEPEVTEPEVKEPETTGTSSDGAKDKFQQGEAVEYKNEDFEMTVESCYYITLAGALELAGRVADGKVNAGDIIYINDADGKFVAETKVIGVTMFSKLLDEAQKGDNIGLRIDLDVETWKSKILTGYVASATKGTVSSRPSTGTRPSTGVTRPGTTTEAKVFYADVTAMVSPNDSGKIAYVVDAFNGSGDYSYRWEHSSNGSNWDSSSYKTNTYEGDARASGYRRCKVTDNSTGEVIYTPAIAPNMVAKYGPFENVKNDSIKAAYVHPTKMDTFGGKDAMYTSKDYELHAIVIGGTEPYTYQWSYAEKNSDSFEVFGTNQSSIKLVPSEELAKIKCVVTDANGKNVTSEIFNVTVVIDLSGN